MKPVLEYLVVVIREKELKYISMKTANYTDGPIGQVEIVSDFLPIPQELFLQEEKVTLSLNTYSFSFGD